MFVVEFRFGSPILQEALDRVPELTVTYEELYRKDDGVAAMFWAEGGDFDAFEAAIEDDPTVTDAACLTETKTRRLYRVRYTEEGVAVATFPEWGGLDISFLDATATHEGWTIRMRMPDRETLTDFRALCEDRDIEVSLESIYEERRDASEAETRLTGAQREALLAARELGYFDVPRSASLSDVGEECDVSAQAVSERIRRGTATLVDAALPAGDE